MIRKIYKVGLIALGAWLAITLLTGCSAPISRRSADPDSTIAVKRYQLGSLRYVDVFTTETGERVFVYDNVFHGWGGIAVYPTGE